VQSGRLPATPLVRTKRDVIDDDRCALLASIRQLVPDHAARCRALQVESHVVDAEQSSISRVCVFILLLAIVTLSY